jgi:hypothetical protein
MKKEIQRMTKRWGTTNPADAGKVETNPIPSFPMLVVWKFAAKKPLAVTTTTAIVVKCLLSVIAPTKKERFTGSELQMVLTKELVGKRETLKTVATRISKKFLIVEEHQPVVILKPASVIKELNVLAMKTLLFGRGLLQMGNLSPVVMIL